MNTTRNYLSKMNCFDDYSKGGSVDHLVEKYGISRSTFYRWIKDCETPVNPVILHPLDKKNLAETNRQKQMIEIYQKTGLGITSPFLLPPSGVPSTSNLKVLMTLSNSVLKSSVFRSDRISSQVEKKPFPSLSKSALSFPIWPVCPDSCCDCR